MKWNILVLLIHVCLIKTCFCRTEGAQSDDDNSDVSLPELADMIQDGGVQLFDVREPEEVEKTGSIPTATNIPVGQVEEAFMLSDVEFEERFKTKKPNRDDGNIVLCCLSGMRAKRALDSLVHLGYSKARRYPGGWKEWEKHLQEDAESLKREDL